MDDETRQLHTEGCAPKLQYSAEQIKREPSSVDAIGDVRLPARLPIASPKVEDVKPKKVHLLRIIGFATRHCKSYLKYAPNFAGEKEEKGEKGEKTEESEKREKEQKEQTIVIAVVRLVVRLLVPDKTIE